jgi:hypothetical protein
MKAALLILVALVLSLTAYAEEGQWSKDQRIGRLVYKEACRMSNYKCDIKAPIVRRSETLETRGLNGMYIGGDIIWINDNLRGTQAWLTIFHETVHYLQIQGKPMKVSPDVLWCALEWEAADLTNQYVDVLGAADFYKRSYTRWQGIYSC